MKQSVLQSITSDSPLFCTYFIPVCFHHMLSFLPYFYSYVYEFICFDKKYMLLQNKKFICYLTICVNFFSKVFLRRRFSALYFLQESCISVAVIQFRAFSSVQSPSFSQVNRHIVIFRCVLFLFFEQVKLILIESVDALVCFITLLVFQHFQDFTCRQPLECKRLQECHPPLGSLLQQE